MHESAHLDESSQSVYYQSDQEVAHDQHPDVQLTPLCGHSSQRGDHSLGFCRHWLVLPILELELMGSSVASCEFFSIAYGIVRICHIILLWCILEQFPVFGYYE